MGFDPDGPSCTAHLDYVRAHDGPVEDRGVHHGVRRRRAARRTRRTGGSRRRSTTRSRAARSSRCPGAETALGALRAMDVRICLTTGFSRPTREQIIDVLGWRDLVDLSLNPEDGIRGRPYPDLVLTALMRLDVDDVRCVAVAGDTTSDIVSGHRAGAQRRRRRAHRRRTTRARLSEASPTHVLDSIDEPPRRCVRSARERARQACRQLSRTVGRADAVRGAGARCRARARRDRGPWRRRRHGAARARRRDRRSLRTR